MDWSPSVCEELKCSFGRRGASEISLGAGRTALCVRSLYCAKRCAGTLHAPFPTLLTLILPPWHLHLCFYCPRPASVHSSDGKSKPSVVLRWTHAKGSAGYREGSAVGTSQGQCPWRLVPSWNFTWTTDPSQPWMCTGTCGTSIRVGLQDARSPETSAGTQLWEEHLKYCCSPWEDKAGTQGQRQEWRGRLKEVGVGLWLWKGNLGQWRTRPHVPLSHFPLSSFFFPFTLLRHFLPIIRPHCGEGCGIHDLLAWTEN